MVIDANLPLPQLAWIVEIMGTSNQGRWLYDHLAHTITFSNKEDYVLFLLRWI